MGVSANVVQLLELESLESELELLELEFRNCTTAQLGAHAARTQSDKSGRFSSMRSNDEEKAKSIVDHRILWPTKRLFGA